MSWVTAIDPGNNTGIAVFKDGVLSEAAVVEGDMFDASGFSGELVIEIPRIYPNGKGKGDPNQIVSLGVMAGQIIGRHRNVTRYAPHAWKAQVDGDIMCERILSFLIGEERKRLDGILAGVKHNAIDAVGIGLFHLRRMGRGGR